MRARQLEVFTAVMRAGTVTGAARLLNISQPALSQVLMHCEDELGFPLFDREKGRLRPTPEALELYPEAERLFASLEGLRRKTQDLRLGRAGLVRIASSAPPAMSLLPQVMAAFRARHPDILLRSHVAPIATLISMLRAGDAALALALDDRLAPDIDVEILRQVGFCCLLPEGHPLADKPALTFADLEAEHVISYRAATRPHDELDQAARAQGLRFAPQLEIDVSISAVGFVQAGLGVAVVDDLLPWGQFSGVVTRPLTGAPDMPLALLTLAGKALSRAESLMADQIRAAIP
ncbi:LysR substrate-binding domain-containing protein [Donghicola sp.]|jgi:DNA-binding transcriptional LysR family regulator|uniref:LysR family transcriptional regulator n=1 Tax=Donghicola sp. TaxID=1929294 RepID=UPI0025D140BC|nr:LysR substrate-binding domain-containing protein [Donghicola sp.]MCT4579661.1 LysR substrate-binding domain-containing protein [Donghicola sp.]